MDEKHVSASSKRKLPIIIGVVVFLLLLLAGGGYYILNSEKSAPAQDEEQVTEDIVKAVTAEELGLTLTPIQNNQVITMEITKLTGISTIDYEVSYDAIENGETVGRGVVGSAEVEGSTIERKIDLGTCSRNVCKYDKGVEVVKFVLRINYIDGTVGELEEELTLKTR